jgi:hypothetical protein
MRLIRSKIYRAIPELDRFTDGQCRRFVAAANSSWRRRLIRWALVLLAGVIGLAVALAGIMLVMAGLEHLTLGRDLGDTATILIGVAAASVAFAIGLIPTLILRDILLRLTIRRLIRRCGSCPKCHYTLLGMPVRADHSITCPECGLKIDVDLSMGELATNEQGAAVYKPEIARIHEVTLARRRRRHKLFFKAAGVAVLLAISAAAGYWLFLVNQAHRAAGDRKALAQLRSLQESMWPGGPSNQSEAEFARYADAIVAVSKEADSRLYTGTIPATANNVGFDATTLRSDADRATFDKNSGEGSFDACRAFTLDVLRRAREHGAIDGLRVIPTLKSPIRAMAPPGDEPFIGVLLPDLGHARAAARLNGARMILAVQQGDRAEFMEALEEALAIGQICERQGLLIDRLVANAIDGLIFQRLEEDRAKFPGAAWFEDALALLSKRAVHPPLSKTVDAERIAALDTVAWFFSNPRRIAKAQFGISDPDNLGYGLAASIRSRVGTYTTNKDVLNSVMGSYIAAADFGISKRTGIITAPTGYAVLDQMIPSVGSAFRSSDTIAYQQRLCTLNLACDLFKLRSGRPPSGPQEIAQLLTDPATLIDPLSDKPFRFSVPNTVEGTKQKFEIQDGQDNEPKPGQYKPRPPTPPRKGTDTPPPR